MKNAATATVLAGIATVPALASDGEFEVLEQKVLELAASTARVTAREAIESAMQETGEARLAEVELQLKGAGPVFGLEFLTSDGELEIVVDAVSGRVLDRKRAQTDDDGVREYERLGAAETTLTQAIEIVLREVQGSTVLEAEAEHETEGLVYEIELLVDGEFMEMHLRADGTLLLVEERRAEGQAWIFEGDPPGQPPTGWEFRYTRPSGDEASWNVREDSEASSGSNVLAVRTSGADQVFNVALATGTSYRDVDVRARVRPESGEVDQGGGVIWRCLDENNYYICRVNPLESNFRVYRVVDGKRKQLQSCKIETRPGTWYVVRARMVGDHITCYVDGEKWLDVHDDTFEAAGTVGLWTKADASSSFDDVAVQAARAPGESDADREPEKDDD